MVHQNAKKEGQSKVALNQLSDNPEKCNSVKPNLESIYKIMQNIVEKEFKI